jgi:hypothetical protein
MKLKAAALGLLFLTVFVSVISATPQDQPNMVAARADLNIAKRELMVAEHNKGGHRAKAIEYINAAIVQINKGIAYSRRNNHAQSTTINEIFASANVPDQPHMRAALDSLKSAKGKLENATADKGGHRVKAIELINLAIDEVNKGIAAAS